MSGTRMSPWQIVLAALALAVALGAARAQQPQDDAEGTDGAASPAPTRAGDEPQTAPPATTFTPSERIGADSAVSFPVDI
jgi:hypothetical protein